ncbi:MAG: DUF401 family protein [Bacillota bacterium]
MSYWPIVKIVAVFLLIIIMLRKKVSLDITLLVSTAALGFVFGLGIVPLLKQLGLTLIAPYTVELISILVLIMVLESVMRQTGMLQAMTDSLFKFPWNSRLLIASIPPAIIGFLPSAGGARFSAPLVGQATLDMSYRAEDKVFINYWFRHVWEYSLPLYPGLIIAANISGIPVSNLILWLWPFTVIWAALGYFHIWRRYGRQKDQDHSTGEPGNGAEHGPSCGGTGQSLRELLANTWPLWSTVVLVLCRVSIVFTLSGVLCLLIMQKRYSLRAVWKTLTDPLTLRIVFLTWGTMAFKDVLSASGAVQQVSGAFSALSIPALVVVTVLPLAIGMLTGMVQASIGVSFPLVMGIIEPSAAYAMLAYVSGVAGVMISPIHLCLILTIEYFRADFIHSYKPLVAPTLLMVTAALVMFRLLH